MPISIKMTGLPETRQAVINLPQKIERQALLEMSELAHEAMLAGADRHTKTGALFQSVFNRQTPSGTGREVGHDTERAPHAVFVLFGTRDHFVSPREKKALRWPTGAATGSGFAFSKGHMVRGYQGDDYMTTAAGKALDGLRQIIDDISVFE